MSRPCHREIEDDDAITAHHDVAGRQIGMDRHGGCRRARKTAAESVDMPKDLLAQALPAPAARLRNALQSAVDVVADPLEAESALGRFLEVVDPSAGSPE